MFWISFNYLNKFTFIYFKSLVRPHLDFVSQIWSPYLKQDIEILERVQKRVSKVPYNLKNLSYRERLNKLGWKPLTERRLRGDLIELYKVLRCGEPINWIDGPKLSVSLMCEGPASAVRGNSLRLIRETFKTAINNRHTSAVNLRHRFFVNRVVPHWNNLPESVVRSSSVSSFKEALDNHMKRLL